MRRSRACGAGAGGSREGEGRGCHLRATEADGAESEFDLYPHRFDALHPGTKHMAYNLNETSSCENLNMMLADPAEVLPPVSSHKPKPR